MKTACPLSEALLIDYWSSELSPPEVERVEEHLLSCPRCSAESARVAAIALALRGMIPPLLTGALLATLRARGLRIVENSFSPGERHPIVFEPDVDLMIHRLGGLDLARATSVDVTLRVEESGDVIFDLPGAPFDPASGELLLACQRHFAVFPPNLMVEVRARGPSASERIATYLIPHEFRGETR